MPFLLPALAFLPLITLVGQGDFQRPTGLGALIDDSVPTPISDDVETRMGQPGYMAFVKDGREAWTGVRFVPKAGVFDLHKFGHVEAVIINAGSFPFKVTLRVENSGSAREKHWNEETISIPPGKERYLETHFGYQNGFKRGYKLDGSKIASVTVFAVPDKGARIEGERCIMLSLLRAGGIKGEKPEMPKPRSDGFGGNSQ